MNNIIPARFNYSLQLFICFDIFLIGGGSLYGNLKFIVAVRKFSVAVAGNVNLPSFVLEHFEARQMEIKKMLRNGCDKKNFFHCETSSHS